MHVLCAEEVLAAGGQKLIACSMLVPGLRQHVLLHVAT